MKLTTITQLTLDGVTQGNGGPSAEDREGGFERGGWARGAGDDATRDHIAATFQRADAFLIGRRTYDILLDFWGTIEDLKRHPIGAALNAKPKYVASRTLTVPEWANTTVLGDDLFAAVTDQVSKTEGVGSVSVSSPSAGSADSAKLTDIMCIIGSQRSRVASDARTRDRVILPRDSADPSLIERLDLASLGGAQTT